METVAFPKESDVATTPNLVQMVPLCQIALDPHLCHIGYDGNGLIALDPHLCHVGYDGNIGISKGE